MSRYATGVDDERWTRREGIANFGFAYLSGLIIFVGGFYLVCVGLLGYDERAVGLMAFAIAAIGLWWCLDHYHWRVNGTPLPAFPWRLLDRKSYRESRAQAKR